MQIIDVTVLAMTSDLIVLPRACLKLFGHSFLSDSSEHRLTLLSTYIDLNKGNAFFQNC